MNNSYRYTTTTKSTIDIADYYNSSNNINIMSYILLIIILIYIIIKITIKIKFICAFFKISKGIAKTSSELEEIKKILKNNDSNNKLSEKEYIKQCEQQKNSNN